MSERIAKNLYWQTETPYGDLEITVNLSKPEKDPKEIAKLKFMKSSSYPKCLLCPENVGYAGRLNHPARQNLRQIPMNLQGEQWYLQYSAGPQTELEQSQDRALCPFESASRSFLRLSALPHVDGRPDVSVTKNA